MLVAALALLVPSGASEAEVPAVDGSAAQEAEPLRDTKKNRVRLAVKYLKEHPVEDMFDDMLNNYLSNSEPKQRDQMRAAMDRVNTKKVGEYYSIACDEDDSASLRVDSRKSEMGDDGNIRQGSSCSTGFAHVVLTRAPGCGGAAAGARGGA